MAIVMSHGILQFCTCCRRMEILESLLIRYRLHLFLNFIKHVSNLYIIVFQRTSLIISFGTSTISLLTFVSRTLCYAQKLYLNTIRSSTYHYGCSAWTCGKPSIPSIIQLYLKHYDPRDYLTHTYH